MDKTGVFISHITEEKETALCLKEFLRESLGWGLPVFVSSDYESIPGGDIWFDTIVKALKRLPVEIVLLSPDSAHRPWINFEAGVGIGAESLVIPVVVNGLARSDVGHPLSSLQIRSLESDLDVRALLNDVGKKLEITPRISHMARFLSDINMRMPENAKGWRGVEWQGCYLAVEGPVLKMTKRDDQICQDSMEIALKQGGFTPYLIGRYDLGRALSKGYKIVHVTDRRTFYAEITRFDVLLAAKAEEPKV